MNKIVFATNNENKLREAREILAPLGIEVISQRDAGADCDPEENGSTFEENAMIKAEAVYNIVKCPVIADDSGLCIDALNGRPGVFSARYAPDSEKCKKILDEMKNVDDDDRTACFECAIAYIDEKATEMVTGVCEGKIGYEERGTNGFGYDPIFMCNGRSLAEMTADEKNKISHRGDALRGLYNILKRKVNENAYK